MDDGVTALNAQKMGEGILGFTDGGNSGRFRPVYWIYYSGLYRLIGIHPLAFYLFHALLLVAVIAILALLVRRLGGSRMQAFLAAVLTLSAGPMVENFYTLSKSEPLHALLTLVGLLVMLNLPQQMTKWGRVLIFGGAVLIFTAAAFAKEFNQTVLLVDCDLIAAVNIALANLPIAIGFLYYIEIYLSMLMMMCRSVFLVIINH